MADGELVLGFDPSTAVEHLRNSDATLAHVIDSVGSFRMERAEKPSIFHALAEAIVYQQLTGKAAATIFARLCALFPGSRGGLTADQILGASDEELRGVGLSRSKLLSLRDLAQRTANGEIPTRSEIDRMEDEALIERLTEVRGIGRWTAEMFLMFHELRPDVLPVDDLGLQRALADHYNGGERLDRRAMLALAEPWRPWRSVATWYLWRSLDPIPVEY